MSNWRERELKLRFSLIIGNELVNWSLITI